MLLERTSARPVGSMPAGGGSSPDVCGICGVPEFETPGPVVTRVRMPIPLSFDLMVAVLAELSLATRADLATPEDVRHQIDSTVIAYGHLAALTAAERLATQPADGWVQFCRQAVAGMLAADAVTAVAA